MLLKKRNEGEIAREGGALLSTQPLAKYGKHAFVLIAGLRVCLYRCSIGGGHAARNMPPLAFGIPMNNTVNDRFIIGGFIVF